VVFAEAEFDIGVTFPEGRQDIFQYALLSAKNTRTVSSLIEWKLRGIGMVPNLPHSSGI
jgi:hypothetical protein